MRLYAGTRLLPIVLDALNLWFPRNQADLLELRGKCDLGLQIDITPIKRKHTDSQKGAYWASLHELGKHLGYTPRLVETLLHDTMLCEAYGTLEVASLMVNGEFMRYPIPKARSSVDEQGRARDVQTYSLLIETLLRVSAEYGYYIDIGAKRA